MNLYKIDTHVHTVETSPCGRVSGADVAIAYKNAGYQGIIITDHYYDGFFNSTQAKIWEDKVDAFLVGYREAFAKGKEIGIDVFLGMELRFIENANDYLVFGIDESFLKKHKELYNLNLEEFRTLTENMNILVYQAHPFRQHVTPADPKLLDGVEVYNGNPRHDSSNDLALTFAKENNLKFLSGSDFHHPEDLARGGIATSKRINNIEELLAVLRDDKGISLISA